MTKLQRGIHVNIRTSSRKPCQNIKFKFTKYMKGMWQLHAILDLQFSFPIKDIIRTIGRLSIRLIYYLKYYITINFLAFIIVIKFYENVLDFRKYTLKS